MDVCINRPWAPRTSGEQLFPPSLYDARTRSAIESRYTYAYISTLRLKTGSSAILYFVIYSYFQWKKKIKMIYMSTTQLLQTAWMVLPVRNRYEVVGQSSSNRGWRVYKLCILFTVFFFLFDLSYKHIYKSTKSTLRFVLLFLLLLFYLHGM